MIIPRKILAKSGYKPSYIKFSYIPLNGIFLLVGISILSIMGALQPFSLDKFIDTIVKNLAFSRILNFQMFER
jgi:hypothetical protein